MLNLGMETIIFPLPGRVTVKEPLISSSDSQPISYNVISSRLLPAGTILQCQFLKDSGDNFHRHYEPTLMIFDNQQSLKCEANFHSKIESITLNDSDKCISSPDVVSVKVPDRCNSDDESFEILNCETSMSSTSSDPETVEIKRTFFTNGVERFKKIGLTTSTLLKSFSSHFQRNQLDPQTKASDPIQLTRDVTSDHLDTLKDNDPIPLHLSEAKQNDHPEVQLTIERQQENNQITFIGDDNDNQADELPNTQEINEDEGHSKDEKTNKSDEHLVNQLIEMIEATITESTIEQLVEYLEINQDGNSIIKKSDGLTNKIKTDLNSDEKRETEDNSNDEAPSVAVKIPVDMIENLNQNDAPHESSETQSCQPINPIDSTDCVETEETTIEPENERNTCECTDIEPDQNLSIPSSLPEIYDQQPCCSKFNQPECTTIDDECTLDKEEKQSPNEMQSQLSDHFSAMSQCNGIDKRRISSDESTSSCENHSKKRRLTNGLNVTEMDIRPALTLVVIENGWKQDGDRTNRIFQSIYECHGRYQNNLKITIEANCIKIFTEDRESRLILLRELQAINKIVKETSPYQLYIQNPLKPSIQFLVHDTIYNLSCPEFISQIRMWNNWNEDWTVHIESKEWIRKIRKGKISLIVDSRIRDKLELEDLIIKIENDPVKVFDKFGITQCSVCLRFGHSKCRSRIRCFFCSEHHHDKIRHDKYTETRYCFLCRMDGHTPIAKNCPTLINEIRSKLELIDYQYKDIFLGNDRSY